MSKITRTKRPGDVAQAIECQHHKGKALSSKPNTTKKEKQTTNKQKTRCELKI
jgi:hypothetical protein